MEEQREAYSGDEVRVLSSAVNVKPGAGSIQRAHSEQPERLRNMRVSDVGSARHACDAFAETNDCLELANGNGNHAALPDVLSVFIADTHELIT